jgi:hypothetical protein
MVVMAGSQDVSLVGLCVHLGVPGAGYGVGTKLSAVFFLAVFPCAGIFGSVFIYQPSFRSNPIFEITGYAIDYY